jgi:hypothetical protein
MQGRGHNHGILYRLSFCGVRAGTQSKCLVKLGLIRDPFLSFCLSV